MNGWVFEQCQPGVEIIDYSILILHCSTVHAYAHTRTGTNHHLQVHDCVCLLTATISPPLIQIIHLHMLLCSHHHRHSYSAMRHAYIHKQVQYMTWTA